MIYQAVLADLVFIMNATGLNYHQVLPGYSQVIVNPPGFHPWDIRYNAQSAEVRYMRMIHRSILAFARSSHQIRSEILPLYYAQVEFIIIDATAIGNIPGFTDLRAFIGPISNAQNAGMLRRILVEHYGVGGPPAMPRAQVIQRLQAITGLSLAFRMRLWSGTMMAQYTQGLNGLV
jgi:hypothetical protein